MKLVKAQTVAQKKKRGKNKKSAARRAIEPRFSAAGKDHAPAETGRSDEI
jgi:hypothetical protein